MSQCPGHLPNPKIDKAAKQVFETTLKPTWRAILKGHVGPGTYCQATQNWFCCKFAVKVDAQQSQEGLKIARQSLLWIPKGIYTFHHQLSMKN